MAMVDLGSHSLCKKRVKLPISKGQFNESRLVVYRIFYRALRPRSSYAMVLTAVLDCSVLLHILDAPA